jgi:cytochrome P450
MPEVVSKMPKTKLTQVIETNRGLATDFLNYLDKKAKIYGENWIMELGFMQMYIISNPDAIKHILQTNQKNYIKSRSYDALKMAVGNGLVTSEGSFWRKQRRLSQPAFYKKNLENLFKDMGHSTQEYIDELDKKRGQVVDISKDMMHLTATIVLRALFHVEENESLGRVGEAIDQMQEYVMKYINTPYLIPFLRINGEHTRFLKERDEMDALIYKMVNDRIASGEKKEDLLQMLMDVEDADTGEKMTEKQLRDELVTLFAAGHETSSNIMTFALMLLAEHPEVMKKLRTEVDKVLPNKEFPTFAQLRSLKYTEQVINETLRLYPAAWAIGRQAKEDDIINGYLMPKDKPIFLSVWNLHRSEKYWDKPLEFNPDRFAPEQVKQRPNHYFIPFGAGPRMCIGNHFAMMEMQLILATLVQRFDFEMAEGFKNELAPLITLRPKNGMLMKIK